MVRIFDIETDEVLLIREPGMTPCWYLQWVYKKKPSEMFILSFQHIKQCLDEKKKNSVRREVSLIILVGNNKRNLMPDGQYTENCIIIQYL